VQSKVEIEGDLTVPILEFDGRERCNLSEITKQSQNTPQNVSANNTNTHHEANLTKYYSGNRHVDAPCQMYTKVETKVETEVESDKKQQATE
jgi:hypothetical protein